MKEVAIIGGGASGLAAAIAAARCGAQVTLLEASEHAGKPILATGNGRCNLTNARVSASDYNHPGFVEDVLASYGVDEVLGFFAGLGLATVEEGGGRIYPLSRTASSVVDVLRSACTRLGVDVRCGSRARGIRREGARGRLHILVEDGAPVEAESVVVATGGGTSLLSELGHDMAPFRPTLCSLATDTRPLRGLDGVRVRAWVSAFHAGDREPFSSECGELLFRTYGVSGIVVFDLSRFVGEGDVLALDLLPDTRIDEAATRIRGLLARQLSEANEHGAPSPTFAELFAGLFHPRVAAAVLRGAGLKPSLPAEPGGADRAIEHAKDFRVRVTGVGDARHAQVTRGGAAVGGFDPSTLESCVAPGVFACGETLDVDGPCGGYNLHWAWASGLTAGNAAAHWKDGRS